MAGEHPDCSGTPEEAKKSSSTFRFTFNLERRGQSRGGFLKMSKNYGLGIKLLREAMSLTSKELAERADLTPSIVSLIENGERQVSYEDACRIAAALEVPVDAIAVVASRPEVATISKKREEIENLWQRALLDAVKLRKSAKGDSSAGSTSKHRRT